MQYIGLDIERDFFQTLFQRINDCQLIQYRQFSDQTGRCWCSKKLPAIDIFSQRIAHTLFSAGDVRSLPAQCALLFEY